MRVVGEGIIKSGANKVKIDDKPSYIIGRIELFLMRLPKDITSHEYELIVNALLMAKDMVEESAKKANDNVTDSLLKRMEDIENRIREPLKTLAKNKKT
jgi:hypothetical protein